MDHRRHTPALVASLLAVSVATPAGGAVAPAPGEQTKSVPVGGLKLFLALLDLAREPSAQPAKRGLQFLPFWKGTVHPNVLAFERR
jgi:hypothetical protein